jgi:HlyD family secretion protein
MRISGGRSIAAGALLCAALAAGYLFALGPLSAGRGLSEAAARADLASVSSAPPQADRVSALGRLEPEDGVIRLAGPSSPSVVIAKLYVDDGDLVKQGQLIATLDTLGMLNAAVQRLDAELGNARRELGRYRELHRDKVASDSQRESWELRVHVAEAELARARAELELAHVRSPLDGQVLKVHAREGERVGPDGIVELGKTDHMFAIAEVYEEDIRRVHVGQPAVVTSPALIAPLGGKVDWINLRVAKQDAIGNDPAARKDARVVEVKIRLADSKPAAGLTNLQVEVAIGP